MALLKLKIERALRHSDRIMTEAPKLMDAADMLLASACHLELNPHLPHVAVEINQKWKEAKPVVLDLVSYREVRVFTFLFLQPRCFISETLV